MRRDLNPLCDRHLKPMRPDVVYMVVPGKGPYWAESYACKEPGCSRLYAVKHGYFTHNKSNYHPEEMRQHPCPEHAGKFLSLRQEGGVQVWTCDEEGCKGVAQPSTEPASELAAR